MTPLITRARALADTAIKNPDMVGDDPYAGGLTNLGRLKEASRELVPQLCDALDLAVKALEGECSCCNDEWTGEKVMCDPCLALKKLRDEGA